MTTQKQMVFVGGNGYVYAINTSDGEVVWELELKPGWLKTGNKFVSMMEDGPYIYAFAYGTFYKIDKETGELICAGKEIKKLKDTAGVFSVDPDASTGGSIVIGTQGGDGSGDGNGGGNGGGE